MLHPLAFTPPGLPLALATIVCNKAPGGLPTLLCTNHMEKQVQTKQAGSNLVGR
jgi:hypothetical protein